MRVSKSQLINGFLTYVENEVVPGIKDDKTKQIIFSIAIKAIRTNPAIADKLLENQVIKTLLDQNEDGYEIDGLFDAITDSIKEYGPFTIEIPAIPIISPVENVLSFSESDVAEIKRRIERSTTNG